MMDILISLNVLKLKKSLIFVLVMTPKNTTICISYLLNLLIQVKLLNQMLSVDSVAIMI